MKNIQELIIYDDQILDPKGVWIYQEVGIVLYSSAAYKRFLRLLFVYLGIRPKGVSDE